MSFTFMVCDRTSEDGQTERVICPVNEETGSPYINHSFDPKSFVDQYNDGVIIEVSEPTLILKKQLTEAKRLLEIAKKKLMSPGRDEIFSEEIERFLNK